MGIMENHLIEPVILPNPLQYYLSQFLSFYTQYIEETISQYDTTK